MQENDQEDNNTNEENQTNITDTSIESMSIPVIQNDLLRAENDHLRAEYDSLTYQGTQLFDQYVKQFKEYKDKLKKDSSDDDKKKTQFLNRILTENEEVNAIAWQLADDKSITYEASKTVVKNACDKYLSTGLYTQPSDDELYSITDSSLPTQNEIQATSCTDNVNMQTMTRNESDISLDNSATTVMTTNTDIRGEIQTAVDDL